MSRAAARVDVAPVRLGGDRLDLGSEPLEDRRGGAVGGAVGAVEHHPPAGEVEREGGLEGAQVVLETAVQLAHVARLGGGDISIQQRLDPRLGLVVELCALGREELDAVVAVGVVRGGHDGRQVEAEPLDEDRCCGGRQHSAQQRVATRGCDPGGQRRLQHRARLARVAYDQDLRPLCLKRSGRRPTQLDRQLGAEERASLPSDPVGSEELALHRHRASVSAC